MRTKGVKSLFDCMSDKADCIVFYFKFAVLSVSLLLTQGPSALCQDTQSTDPNGQMPYVGEPANDADAPAPIPYGPASTESPNGPVEDELPGTSGDGTPANPTRNVSYDGDSKSVTTNYTNTAGPATDEERTTHKEFSTYKWDYETAAWKLESKSGSEDVYKTWDLTTGTKKDKGNSSKSYTLLWTFDASGAPSAGPTKTLENQSRDQKIDVEDGKTVLEESWTQQGDDIYTRVGDKYEISDVLAVGNGVFPDSIDRLSVDTVWSLEGYETITTIRVYKRHRNLPFPKDLEGRSVTVVTSRNGTYEGRSTETSEDWYSLVNGAPTQLQHLFDNSVYDKDYKETYGYTEEWSYDVANNEITHKMSTKNNDKTEIASVTVDLQSVPKHIHAKEFTGGEGVDPPLILGEWDWIPGGAWNADLQYWYQRITGNASPPPNLGGDIV